MTVYFLAALSLTDREAYDRYEIEAAVSHRKYGAECGTELLAICDMPEVLEGTLPGNRIVLLRFEDQAALDKWYQSPEYQRAIPLRAAASETKFVISFPEGRPAMPHVGGTAGAASGAGKISNQ